MNTFSKYSRILAFIMLTNQYPYPFSLNQKVSNGLKYD